MKRIYPIPALLLFASVLAACAAPPSVSLSSGTSSTTSPMVKLNVVTTVSPITNIVDNVGGDKITLSGIIPEGADSHTFEPIPSNAAQLAKADIVFVNGLKLEEPTLRMAEANKKAGSEIVKLGEQTIKPDEYMYDFSFPKELGSPNPHLWMNPINALRYAEIARDTFVRRDPNNADYFKANYDKFKVRIEALDKAIKETIQSIPEKNRVLLTYHDSFAYFAPRYGMTVLGAIQPSNFAEPSAKEVADLITQIKKENVPAIFGSEVFPSKVLDQIGKEAGVTYVDTLRDDDLPGDPGDPQHSYVRLMVEDVSTMAKALGGKPELISGIDTSNVPGLDSAVSQPK